MVILLIIAELICIGFAALLRRRARQGSDAPHLGIMGVIVALSDFLAAIFAVAIAYNAQVFGAWTGLGVAIIMNLLAGVALAQTIAARRGLDISAKDTLLAPRRHPLPSLVGGVAGYVVVGGLPGLLIGAIFGASLSYGQRVRRNRMAADQLKSPLAAVLGVSESVIESIEWGITPAGEIIVPHPPAQVLNHLDSIPSRCATHLPDLRVEVASASEGIVLSPLDDETKAQRERAAQLAEQHEGLVVDIRPNESSTPTTDSGNGVDLDLSGEDF